MGKAAPIQTEFRRMVRDLPRNNLPKGSCWTIEDALPNLGGPLRNRGGWTNYSDDISGVVGTASYVIAGIYADQLATPRLVIVDEDGNLARVATDGTGDVTNIGAGVVTLQNPVQLGGRIMVPASNGTSVPKTWDGTTLADLGGSPPAGKYAGVWKSLGLLAASNAQPQRGYFTTADNNLQSWDTTNTFWDFSYPITGIAPLRNAVLYFHEDYTSRLRGSTPPPGGDLIADDPLFNVGCADARSIAFWGEQVVWANTDGLYISDGIMPNDLTLLCGMKSYWQELLAGYSAANWTICAGVIRNSYVVCVMDGTTFKDCAIIDLQRNSWTRHTNIDARSVWRTTALSGSELLFFGRRGAARVAEMSSMWKPTLAVKNDGDGDAVTYDLETPFYEFATGLDLLRDLYVTYECEEASDDITPTTVSVSYVTDPAETSYTSAGSLAANTGRTRKRVTINRVGLGFGLRFTQVNASSDSRMWEIDAEGYGLEQNRLV